MKKLIIVFVFAIIANNSFAQTGTDSLLRYTLNLETMSQREQANKEYLEQKESSGFGTIRIIPEASYKHISAEMSFPEGRIYNGAIVKFELLNNTIYENISMQKRHILYGRAYIHPCGRLHASATFFPVYPDSKYVCFDVFDLIDGHLGTIANTEPGWLASFSGELQLNDINLGIAKAAIIVKNNANNVLIKIKKDEKFLVMLIARYTDK